MKIKTARRSKKVVLELKPRESALPPVSVPDWKTFTTIVIAAGGLCLTGCNRSVESASDKFNVLPPAVQKTVRTQAPNAEIANVSQKTRDGIELYVVEFREPGKNPKIEVAADGKIFLLSESGKLSVIKAAGEWEILSVGDLNEECWSTPAITDSLLFVRTATALYCFGKRV